MKEKGLLIKCDRCGETGFFKTIGDGEMDGGFTRWNKFESAEGWSCEYDIGDLCPNCSQEFEDMKLGFKHMIARCDE